MPNVIKPKRSNSAGVAPTTSNLTSGEIGVNMADRKIYINNGTSIVLVAAGLLTGMADVSVSAPSNGQVLTYNGTNWVNSTPASGGVSSFNTRTGAVTLTSSDVTTALTYTPLSTSGGTISGDLTVGGNITIGSAKRYLGDFSNLTVASRGIFQSSTTNGSTFVTAMPNGTGTATQFQAYNSSDPANASFGSIGVTANQVRIVSSNTGTGSLNPITFLFGTTEVARFTTSGDLLIGTTTDDGVNLLQVTGGTALTGALTIRAANELRLADTDSSNYVGFKSPGTVSTNVVWTLPASDGTNGQVLTTNGAGTLSWASPGASLTGITNANAPYFTALGTGAGSSSSGTNGIAIGYNAGQSISGARNIAIGGGTGNNIGSATDHIMIGDSIATGVSSSFMTGPNILIGNQIGANLASTSGFTSSIVIGHQVNQYNSNTNSVVIGNYASRWVSTSQSVVIGEQAHGWNNTSGFGSAYSVAIGYRALYGLRNAQHNTAVGRWSGYSTTTGGNNTFVGSGSGYGNITGQGNVWLGAYAGYSATNSFSIGVGYQAGYYNTGARFTAVGYQAAYLNSGADTTAVGYMALNTNGAGVQNTAIGSYALSAVSTGQNNTALGHLAGSNATGNQNTFVGANAGASVSTGANNLLLGYDAQPASATDSNQIVLGNTAVNRLRIPGLGLDFTSTVATLISNLTFQRANTDRILEVQNSSATNAVQFYIDNATADTNILNIRGNLTLGASSTLNLRTAGTNRFIVASDGNCFVNATSLDVGNGLAGEKQIWLRNSVRSTYFYLSNSDSSIGIWDATGSFSRWYCTTTGNFVIAGTLTQSSDERIKTNWRDLPETYVEQLAGVKHGVYDRTDLPSTSVGVSAQDMQAILPDAVMTDANDLLAVAYGNAALVSAVALAKRVVQLEARIAQLEANAA